MLPRARTGDTKELLEAVKGREVRGVRDQGTLLPPAWQCPKWRSESGMDGQCGWGGGTQNPARLSAPSLGLGAGAAGLQGSRKAWALQPEASHGPSGTRERPGLPSLSPGRE